MKIRKGYKGKYFLFCFFYFLFFTFYFFSSCKKTNDDVPNITYHTFDFQPSTGQDVSVFYFQNRAGIDSLNASTRNFYGDTVLYANNYTSPFEKTAGSIFIKFDSASLIPASAKIVMAQLYLYGIDTSITTQHYFGNTIPGGGNSYFNGINDSTDYYDSIALATYNTHSDTAFDNTLIIQQVTSPWDAHTITDSTQPSYTSSGATFLAASSGQFEYNVVIDVTNLAKQWQSNPASNYGINIQIANTNYLPSLVYINHQMVFYSSSATETSKHPELVIVYE